MAADFHNSTLLICATPRCGSTYFCGLLRQTKIAGWPGEWLGRAGEQHFREHYGLPESLSFGNYMKALRARRSGSNGFFSVKGMWIQMPPFIARAREAAGFDQTISDREVLKHYLGSLKILYLYREDSLGQAISLYRAQRTRLWSQFSDRGHFIELNAPYDFAAIAQYRNWIEHHNRRWRQFFKENELEVVECRFEDFIKENPTNLINGTLEELGYDLPPVEINDRAPTQKQSDGKTRRWRERFEQRLERQSVFTGSSYDRPYPEAAYGIELQLEKDFLEAREGDLITSTVVIKTPESHSWMDVGNEDGEREAVLEIRLKEKSGDWECYEQVLPEPLIADAPNQVEWILPDSLKPALYRLEIDLLRRGEGCVSKQGGSAAQGFLWVEADERVNQASAYFGVPSSPFPHKPMQVSWLGPLQVEHFPWVRHPQLEWMRFSGMGVAGDDYWIFVPDVGLLSTSEALYPRFFLPSEEEWVTFLGVEENAKIFVRDSTNERLSVKIQAYELPFRADPLFP